MDIKTTALDSHLYRVDLGWTGERAGELKADGLPALAVSAPLEFSGQAGAWTPEHLLVAATASCLMTTFLAIAQASRLFVLSFRMTASGKLENLPEEGYRFTEIVLAPEVGVNPGQMEKAEKVMAKAEKKCFISKSLLATVRVEPRIVAALFEPAG
jgi:peroxiredoxin-like protein